MFVGFNTPLKSIKYILNRVISCYIQPTQSSKFCASTWLKKTHVFHAYPMIFPCFLRDFPIFSLRVRPLRLEPVQEAAEEDAETRRDEFPTFVTGVANSRTTPRKAMWDIFVDIFLGILWI